MLAIKFDFSAARRNFWRFPLFVATIIAFVSSLNFAEESANVAGEKTIAGIKIRPAVTPARWLDNYDEALKQARLQNKPVLMYFTGSDWCGPCIELKERVFSRPEFEIWADKKIIRLYIDSPMLHQLPTAVREQNEKLKAQFGIIGVPQIYFLAPDGEAITSLGPLPVGASAWIDLVEMVMPNYFVSSDSADFADTKKSSQKYNGEWLTDYRQAQKIARQLHRPLLTVFVGKKSAPNSLPLLDAFNAKKFQDYARDNLVSVELDIDAGEDASQEESADDLSSANPRVQFTVLTEAYGIKGLPTAVVISSDGIPAAAFAYEDADADYLATVKRGVEKIAADEKSANAATK